MMYITYTQIYIYIYICRNVCVCVSILYRPLKGSPVLYRRSPIRIPGSGFQAAPSAASTVELPWTAEEELVAPRSRWDLSTEKI